MKSQRKTETGSWIATSDDYILRTARNAKLKIAGTKAKPVLASDENVSDLKILNYIKAAGESGVKINAVTVRRV